MAKTQNDLVTKAYLKEYMDEFREEIKEIIVVLKREILDIKDEIITELRIVRDNQEMHDASHERINKDLNDHEERIEVLEASSKQ